MVSAAAAAGVPRSVVYKWMSAGKKERTRLLEVEGAIVNEELQDLVEFTVRIEQALAQFETGHTATISKASDEEWRAAAWLLERRLPKKWAKKDKLTVSGDGKDGAITMGLTKETAQFIRRDILGVPQDDAEAELPDG